MKNIATGSSRFWGIWGEKLQVGFPAAVPASTAVFMQPSAPNGLPGTGVPNAVRVNKPLELGPAVLYGSQRPKLDVAGSSLKSPLRMRAVGTVNTWDPFRCRIC